MVKKTFCLFAYMEIKLIYLLIAVQRSGKFTNSSFLIINIFLLRLIYPVELLIIPNCCCFCSLCRNIKTLNVLGLAPQVYGIFENGLAYQYYPGVTLNVESVTNDNIWPLVATQMAKMHKVQLGKEVCIPTIIDP